MAYPEPLESVQIDDTNLANLQRAFDDIEANLRSAATVAARDLDDDALAGSRLRIALVDVGAPNSVMENSGGHFKAIYSDENGNCLYVQENPPGISRPCTFEESTTCHAVAKTLKA